MPASDFLHKYQNRKIRAEAAAARVRTAFLRLRTKAGFNPNQRRVPAGNPDGGQWTEQVATQGGQGPARGSRAR